MDLCKLYKKGAFSNSVDPDAKRGFSSESAVFAMLSKFLVIMNNIKSHLAFR